MNRAARTAEKEGDKNQLKSDIRRHLPEHYHAFFVFEHVVTPHGPALGRQIKAVFDFALTGQIGIFTWVEPGQRASSSLRRMVPAFDQVVSQGTETLFQGFRFHVSSPTCGQPWAMPKACSAYITRS
ncbi:hypothetical protein UB46_12905 [Burkholderiaceae bacterium 16]|nr:hypothetical protein UB46_12905 [Burkholderiaceae bacterium 16]